jgi:hypothetical protein
MTTAATASIYRRDGRKRSSTSSSTDATKATTFSLWTRKTS